MSRNNSLAKDVFVLCCLFKDLFCHLYCSFSLRVFTFRVFFFPLYHQFLFLFIKHTLKTAGFILTNQEASLHTQHLNVHFTVVCFVVE